ncbi:uncharacterized protein LOC132061928 [Lycium ferocissimum]|uniref:uncharacterized protein LOC132061928 n=1 Tax=Lycium ferocissimum TaxID=112874 RepID=UPI002814CE46|nr:uncharacterized protein LOC132061928 [Lycium ferocissimum]
MEDVQDEIAYWSTAVICYILETDSRWDRGEKAVAEGVQMFDRKPIVVKPWKLEIDLTKETVDKVLIWIWMPGLDIKYWGRSALTKIAGLVGKPLKADGAIMYKERLTYVRVLVEMPLHRAYPTGVMFENENGKVIEKLIEYEWKPVMCTRCKNFGHEENECRRKQRDEAWFLRECPLADIQKYSLNFEVE